MPAGRWGTGRQQRVNGVVDMGISGTSVRVQLAGAFGALVALTAVAVGVAVTSTVGLRAAEADVAQHAVPYLTGLSDADVAAKAAANDERGYLLTGQASYVAESKGRRTVENAGLAQARATAMTGTQRAAVDRVQSGLEAFNQALDAEFTR